MPSTAMCSLTRQRVPASLTLDLNTGVISGTLTNNDATNGSDYTVAITADDGKQHAGNSRLTKIWPTAIT